jgi:hypothetical protein
MNAMKHGLSAKAIVLEGEDPRQFEALRAGLERDFEVESVVERELVEQLAGSFWRLRRVPHLEVGILQKPVSMNERQDILGKLSRHHAGLLNAVTRTLNLLYALRASRGISRVCANDTPGLIESALRREESAAAPVSVEPECATPPKEQA